MLGFLFLAPYARTTRYEEAFFSLENQGKKARFARAPHDKKKQESGMLAQPELLIWERYVLR